MVTKTVYSRNRGTSDQAWIYLNYYPEERKYSISAGYNYRTTDSNSWFSEEKEYDLNDYLQQFPEWEARITAMKKEIESEER